MSVEDIDQKAWIVKNYNFNPITEEWEPAIPQIIPTGIPFGGRTGESLVKKTDTDYDVEWGPDLTDYLYLLQSDIDRQSSGLVSVVGGVPISLGSVQSKFTIAAGVGYINDGTGSAGTYKRITWDEFTDQNPMDMAKTMLQLIQTAL